MQRKFVFHKKCQKNPNVSTFVCNFCNKEMFPFAEINLSLFQEEINACGAAHMHYVMDVRNRVQPVILLPPMMGTSFVLVALTRLIVSKPKHQVT